MNRIYKYELQLKELNILEIPKGAVPLSVQMQGRTICLWMQVETDNATLLRAFRLYGTGHEVDSDPSEYIGTVQDGSFVWHIYARPEVPNE